MKAKSCNLILAAGAAILCCAAFGEVQLPHSDKPVLLGRPNPALARIDKVFVSVAASVAEPNDEGLAYEGLEAKVIERLKSAGIEALPIFYRGKRVEYGGPHAADFTVNIDSLRLADSQQYVFCIDSSLARDMILPVERGLRIRTDVWKTEPAMQVVSVSDAPEKVIEASLHQADAFVSCFVMANPKGLSAADANAVNVRPKGSPGPPGEKTFVGNLYVASKNSRVFHRGDCSSAARIAQKNLLGYASRQEAIEAGKRPCKRCNP
ncbi:MAG: Ada metal-binding domain-containing protein [Planctomycetota bacterium]|jgi:hypothetical protein